MSQRWQPEDFEFLQTQGSLRSQKVWRRKQGSHIALLRSSLNCPSLLFLGSSLRATVLLLFKTSRFSGRPSFPCFKINSLWSIFLDLLKSSLRSRDYLLNQTRKKNKCFDYLHNIKIIIVYNNQSIILFLIRILLRKKIIISIKESSRKRKLNYFLNKQITKN